MSAMNTESAPRPARPSTRPSAARSFSPPGAPLLPAGRGRSRAPGGLPGQDLAPAEDHLRLFLIQYWGGPQTYNELRGHPRLRMRHARFAIGEAERDAWLRHMRTSLDELDAGPALDAQLWDYLVMAAHSLLNRPSAPAGRPGAHSALKHGPGVTARARSSRAGRCAAPAPVRCG